MHFLRKISIKSYDTDNQLKYKITKKRVIMHLQMKILLILLIKRTKYELHLRRTESNQFIHLFCMLNKNGAFYSAQLR